MGHPQGVHYATEKIALLPNTSYFWLVRAKNNTGMWSDTGCSDGIVLDNTAPQTTISGIDDLWHNQAVAFTLTAQDFGSGVDKTRYSLNGETPGLLYTRPVTIGNDGIYLIKYYSQDKANNIEPVRTAVCPVKIDATAPQAAIKINDYK